MITISTLEKLTTTIRMFNFKDLN
jgi:hypothetical protein